MIIEQLVRQVVLGILSQDLAPGAKLPSVRAMARRHRVHPNTVSVAYHELLEQAWVELRRGSGLYVRSLSTDGSGLDDELAALLRGAKDRGIAPEEVLGRLERLIRPRVCERVLVAEDDPAMREILIAEIGERLACEAHIGSGDGVVVARRAGRLESGASCRRALCLFPCGFAPWKARSPKKGGRARTR